MSNAHWQSDDPLVGTQIDGRYVVTGVLGRGGMGVVYDGVHEQLRRRVAIKVLGPRIASDPTAVQRFLREARTASQLTHGNIVDVSDLGTLPDGRPYLVMVKLQGTDLSQLLEWNGPQTPRRTVELLRGAASALDLVHAKGYVHRDVKPENLMHVTREDGSEAVLLLDFGIVGLITPECARLTADGVVFGTPAYIPPELVRGDKPTASSDIYALATVAFELMTGRTPFDTQNVMLLMQVKLVRQAPPMHEIAGFPIDPRIEAVVATSLAQDPSKRHPTATAFIEALEAAIQAADTEPQPQACGLDEDARERLEKGTGALELSFEPSAPPQTTAPATAKAPASTMARLSTAIMRAPRTKHARNMLIALGVAGALFLLLLWNRAGTHVPAAEAVAAKRQPRARPAPEAKPTPPPSAEPATGVAPPPDLPAPKPAPEAPTVAAKHRPAKPRRLTKASVTRAPSAPSQPLEPVRHTPSATELVRSAQDALVQGHLAAAQKLYEEATRADSKYATAFRGLGLVNERLGHNAAARRALLRAIALAPNDPKNALLQSHLQKLEAAQ